MHQRIVVIFEPLERFPMHALWLAAVAIQNASPPPQSFAKLVCTAGCPVACTFFLRGVAQPATLAAGEIPARCVQHRNTPTAHWAGEPMALAAQVAGCGLRLHPLLYHFAGALHAVGQRNAFKAIHPDSDARHLTVIHQPLPAKAIARHQQTLAGNFADVQRHGIIGLLFAAVATAPPASASAHFYSPVFAEIIWQVEQGL